MNFHERSIHFHQIKPEMSRNRQTTVATQRQNVELNNSNYRNEKKIITHIAQPYACFFRSVADRNCLWQRRHVWNCQIWCSAAICWRSLVFDPCAVLQQRQSLAPSCQIKGMVFKMDTFFKDQRFAISKCTVNTATFDDRKGRLWF